MWEARFKGLGVLDALDLLGGKRNVQRSDVLVQLFHFSATDNREHVWELLKVVRDGNCLWVFVRSGDREMWFPLLLDVMLSVPTSFPISSSTSHTFFSSGVRSQWEPISMRPFSPLSLRRASSALVRIFPAPSTPQGASARPSERAMGMISRSNDRSRICQLPW